jgi:hypothetical protein
MAMKQETMKSSYPWKVGSNYNPEGKEYYVWRQTRELDPGEPMHSGVREIMEGAFFASQYEAQACANALNKEK